MWKFVSKKVKYRFTGQTLDKLHIERWIIIDGIRWKKHDFYTSLNQFGGDVLNLSTWPLKCFKGTKTNNSPLKQVRENHQPLWGSHYGDLLGDSKSKGLRHRGGALQRHLLEPQVAGCPVAFFLFKSSSKNIQRHPVIKHHQEKLWTFQKPQNTEDHTNHHENHYIPHGNHRNKHETTTKAPKYHHETSKKLKLHLSQGSLEFSSTCWELGWVLPFGQWGSTFTQGFRSVQLVKTKNFVIFW